MSFDCKKDNACVVSAKFTNDYYEYNIRVNGEKVLVRDADQSGFIDEFECLNQNMTSSYESYSKFQEYKRAINYSIINFNSKLPDVIESILDKFYNHIGSSPDERWKRGGVCYDSGYNRLCDRKPYGKSSSYFSEIEAGGSITMNAYVWDYNNDNTADRVYFKTPSGVEVSIESYETMTRKESGFMKSITNVHVHANPAEECLIVDTTRKGVEKYLERFDGLISARKHLFVYDPI